MSTSARFIDTLLLDLQGRVRSKRLPISMRRKLLDRQTRLPLSTLAQDIYGEDGEELTGIGLVNGDPDGICIPVERTIAVQPWYPDAEQVIISLLDPDDNQQDKLSPYDPRGQLSHQVDKLASLGLSATVALELEFYLLDGSTRTSGRPVVPDCLRLAGEPNDLQLYDPRILDRMEPVLTRIHDWSEALGIPAETTIAEFGPGQFEINLRHRSDALQAADDAVIFRRIVDRAAQESGLIASFMAKPWTQHGGSGQHVHLSILNKDGNNVFDVEDNKPGKHGIAANLEHAIAGLLNTMADAQLIFAPHGNSYRRIVPGSFAPHRVDWGFDHRAAAIRIPESTGKNARLEHRVAGSDANPYLLLSTLIGGVLHGIKNQSSLSIDPLLPGQESPGERLTHDWLTAALRFGESKHMKEIFGDQLTSAFSAIKVNEAEEFLATVGSVDWDIWLSRV